MVRLNAYPVLCNTDDLYAQNTDTAEQQERLDDARALQTHYEKQWLDRGLTIKYLEWQLTHKTAFEEPVIEIEHDTYRSYGRNYTTGQK